MSYVSSILSHTPVGYWRFSESSGTVAADSSGLGNNGTYVGAVDHSSNGPALSFPNSAIGLTGADGIYVSTPPVAAGTGGVTIECWARWSDNSGTRRYIVDNKSGTTNNAGFSIAIMNGGITTKIANGATTLTVVSTGTAYNDNSWRHIVLVFTRNWDGSAADRARVFVNGIDDTSGTGAASASEWNITSTAAVEIGRFQGSSGGAFVGAIDEVAIYLTALTPTQILAHYNESAPKFSSQPGSLASVAYPVRDSIKRIRRQNGLQKRKATDRLPALHP